MCCFDNEKCHGGHPNNCHASPPSVAGCSPFLFAPFFFGFFHLFSTLAHRSGRVIGTDTLRVFLVSQVSSHGEKHEQESEDNPNVNAHQCPGGKPLRGVSQTCQRIRGRSGGRETVGGDLAILAEAPWSLAPRWLHAGMSVHTTMSGKTRIE